MAGEDAKRKAGGRRTWSVSHLLGALVWRLALVLLVLYGLAQLGIRTEWFRRRVERELSRVAGTDVSVGHVRGTESLNLKIRDVISVTDEGGFDLRVVRIRWRLFRPRGASLLESVRVDGWEATFTADGRGPLSSSVLARMAEGMLVPAGVGLPGRPVRPAGQGLIAGGATDSGGSLGDIPRLEMRWGTVQVRDAGGQALVSVSGLDVLWTAVRRPDGGRVSHLDLRAEEVQVANGPRIAGLHVELIEAGSRQFLGALEADDWGGAARPRSPEEDYRDLFDAMDAP